MSTYKVVNSAESPMNNKIRAQQKCSLGQRYCTADAAAKRLFCCENREIWSERSGLKLPKRPYRAESSIQSQPWKLWRQEGHPKQADETGKPRLKVEHRKETEGARDERTLNYSKILRESVSRTYCPAASTAALFLSKLRYGRHSTVPFLSVLFRLAPSSTQHPPAPRSSSSSSSFQSSTRFATRGNPFRDQNKRGHTPSL